MNENIRKKAIILLHFENFILLNIFNIILTILSPFDVKLKNILIFRLKIDYKNDRKREPDFSGTLKSENFSLLDINTSFCILNMI